MNDNNITILASLVGVFIIFILVNKGGQYIPPNVIAPQPNPSYQIPDVDLRRIARVDPMDVISYPEVHLIQPKPPAPKPADPPKPTNPAYVNRLNPR